jgi:hypothetical protein
MNLAQYDRLWHALVADTELEEQREYLYKHKLRFGELFSCMARYLAGHSAPLVLEIGISSFTRLYKSLWPNMSLVTLDRPAELYGPDAPFALQICGAERHYCVDLNRQPLSASWGEPPLGTFDYILFCEVMEHLIVNPVQLCEELLGLLKPDGYLYLTTPNFFSMVHLQQIARRQNPQPIFPRRGEDTSASHHFRESSLVELIQFVEQAGGNVVEVSYSDCWEDERTKPLLAEHPELRSNLVVVASRADANTRVNTTATKFDSTPEPFSLTDERLFADGNTIDYRELVALQAQEIAYLQTLVRAYESGRFIRFMNWLHRRGLRDGRLRLSN